MKHSIFIIDDSELMRAFLGNLLKDFGEVTLFENGESMLEALRLGYIPNLVILDLNLPGLHGMEILKILQKECGHLPIKTYVVSGVDSSQERISCLALGAIDFIVKPFHPKELTYKIQQGLSLIM